MCVQCLCLCVCVCARLMEPPPGDLLLAPINKELEALEIALRAELTKLPPRLTLRTLCRGDSSSGLVGLCAVLVLLIVLPAGALPSAGAHHGSHGLHRRRLEVAAAAQRRLHDISTALDPCQLKHDRHLAVSAVPLEPPPGCSCSDTWGTGAPPKCNEWGSCDLTEAQFKSGECPWAIDGTYTDGGVLTKSFYVTCVDARTLRKLTSFARFGDGNGKKSTSLLPCLAAVTGSPDREGGPRRADLHTTFFTP